ncbi:hypothetical protein N7516_010653 [Penicillium verrucosum]|uniref:uncharacterized protein n=1 Tax=Penicillium verrucosum TaxID=60171 RepID=UPI0025454237|nr:uncharacterized protein N7516_010653 [Penicillium verrucosum]KAJ5922950.1 hypothetical protein N7516_010653 [Penicillium verrucosum]
MSAQHRSPDDESLERDRVGVGPHSRADTRRQVIHHVLIGQQLIPGILTDLGTENIRLLEYMEVVNAGRNEVHR